MHLLGFSCRDFHHPDSGRASSVISVALSARFSLLHPPGAAWHLLCTIYIGLSKGQCGYRGHAMSLYGIPVLNHLILFP